jgi:hypothetical protein
MKEYVYVDKIAQWERRKEEQRRYIEQKRRERYLRKLRRQKELEENWFYWKYFYSTKPKIKRDKLIKKHIRRLNWKPTIDKVEEIEDNPGFHIPEYEFGKGKTYQRVVDGKDWDSYFDILKNRAFYEDSLYAKANLKQKQYYGIGRPQHVPFGYWTSIIRRCIILFKKMMIPRRPRYYWEIWSYDLTHTWYARSHLYVWENYGIDHEWDYKPRRFPYPPRNKEVLVYLKGLETFKALYNPHYRTDQILRPVLWWQYKGNINRTMGQYVYHLPSVLNYDSNFALVLSYYYFPEDRHMLNSSDNPLYDWRTWFYPYNYWTKYDPNLYIWSDRDWVKLITKWYWQVDNYIYETKYNLWKAHWKVDGSCDIVRPERFVSNFLYPTAKNWRKLVQNRYLRQQLIWDTFESEKFLLLQRDIEEIKKCEDNFGYKVIRYIDNKEWEKVIYDAFCLYDINTDLLNIIADEYPGVEKVYFEKYRYKPISYLYYCYENPAWIRHPESILKVRNERLEFTWDLRKKFLKLKKKYPDFEVGWKFRKREKW